MLFFLYLTMSYMNMFFKMKPKFLEVTRYLDKAAVQKLSLNEILSKIMINYDLNRTLSDQKLSKEEQI